MTVDVNKFLIRKGTLRISIASLAVRMGGGGVQEIVEFFDVFSVVALRSGQPEQALFEERVALVPQGKREARPPVPVVDAEQAVLAPAVGAAPGMIMWEIVPAAAVIRIVLADRAPLTLSQEGPPPQPMLLAASVAREAVTFSAMEIGHR